MTRAELRRIKKQHSGLGADGFAALLGMKRWNVAAMLRGDRNITPTTAEAAKRLALNGTA